MRRPRQFGVMTAAVVVAVGIAAAGSGPAAAAAFTVTTSGTIDSGSDASGLFGVVNGNLAGLAYTEVLAFDRAGSFNYTSATDTTSQGTSTGTAAVTVRGVTFSAPFVDSYSSFLEETPYQLIASNVGDSGGITSSVSATNAFQAAGAVFPVSLSRSFSYRATAADAGLNTDMVQFSVSDIGVNTSFLATPTSIALAVPVPEPEPGSVALLAAGLALAIRRRRVP